MMEYIYHLLQQIGAFSLDVVLFPLTIWTIIASITFILLRQLKQLNPLYQYHLRIAAIAAIPLGLLASFISQYLSFDRFIGRNIETAIFIVQNPVELTVQSSPVINDVSINWFEPNFLIGSISLAIVAVSLILVVRLLFSYSSIKRLYNKLEKQPLTEIKGFEKEGFKQIEIAFSPHSMVPFTFGWRKPIIVLPDLIAKDLSKLEMAIQHELVHIKRGDYLIQLILSGINAIFWFHPLIPFCNKEIESWREISCDQQVLNSTGTSMKQYASMLYELVPLQNSFNDFSVNMAVLESDLKKRISSMHQHKTYKTSIKRSLVFLCLMIIGITVPIACSDLRAPEGLGDEEIENMQMSLMNVNITVNGIDVTKDDASGGVMATGHFALFLTIPEYGVFKFAPTSFEGGKSSGSFNGKEAIFTINNLTVEIESPNSILNINEEIELWAEHFKPESNFSTIGTGAARIETTIQQFLTETANYDKVPTSESSNDNSETFIVVEQMPELIGGLQAIQSKVIYPEQARKDGIEGRVIIQFIVNKDGEVENPKIIRGIGSGCDEAALEAIKQAKFKPGIQRGRPVRVQYSIPIIFRLSDSDFTGSNNIKIVEPHDDWTMGDLYTAINSATQIK